MFPLVVFDFGLNFSYPIVIIAFGYPSLGVELPVSGRQSIDQIRKSF